MKKKLLLLVPLLAIFCFIILHHHTPDPKLRKVKTVTLWGFGYSGMPKPFEKFADKQEALHTVCDKWGIKLDGVGCMYNKTEWDSLSGNNFYSEEVLEAKYGEDWLDKFSKEVEEEDKRESNISK